MKIIEVKKSKVLVDDEDFKNLSLFKWQISKSISGHKYAIRSVSRNGQKKTIRMHREVMGVSESDEHVDHINGNGLDNQKSNLRICTRSQNSRNRKPIKGKKYKGVRKTKSETYASFCGDAYLGVYLTEEEAAHAYNIEAKKQFGEFARLNNVREVPLKKITKIDIRESTRAKMSVAKEGKKYASKRIMCVDDHKSFDSVTEAESFYKAYRGSISRVLSGERKTYKGKKFIYLKQKEDKCRS